MFKGVRILIHSFGFLMMEGKGLDIVSQNVKAKLMCGGEDGSPVFRHTKHDYCTCDNNNNYKQFLVLRN